MKFTCSGCSQALEVDETQDFSTLSCPYCQTPLAPALRSPIKVTSKRSRRSFTSGDIAVVLAGLALVMAGYSTCQTLQIQSRFAANIPSSDPAATVKSFYAMPFRFASWSAEGVEWLAHRSEIIKTLEVVSVKPRNSYALALVRYSIADKIFREGVWLKKVNDKWCIVPYLRLYEPEPEIADDKEWFENASKEADSWKAGK